MYSKKQTNGYIQMSDLCLVIGSLVITYVGSIPFVEWNWLRWILVIPSGCLLGRSLCRWQDKRRQAFVLEQFKWLLEFLLTRLTAGATLENSFLEATTGLGKILGRNSRLMLGLALLSRQLSARQPLNQILPSFSRFLPCPESRRFFQSLAELRDSGGHVSQFVRQQLQRCAERLALLQDLQAETTQRQTEAGIMAVMPILMAFLISDASDAMTGGLEPDMLSVAGMLAAYVMTVAAGSLTFNALGFQIAVIKRQARISASCHRSVRLFKRPGLFMSRIYKNMLPESYGGRLLKILQSVNNPSVSTEVDPCQLFFQIKIAYMLIGLLPGLLLVMTAPQIGYIFPVLPLILCLIHDQTILRYFRQRQIECRLEYPEFLNFISALLQAGLSVHHALDITLRTFENRQNGCTQNQDRTMLQQDLQEIRKMQQIGVPVDQAIEKIAAGCIIPDAQAAFLLISRYERSGGDDILQMLQMQSSTCWSLYRNTVRKQLEQQTLLLLLPMTLDLIAVVLISVLPAIQSLSAI